MAKDSIDRKKAVFLISHLSKSGLVNQLFQKAVLFAPPILKEAVLFAHFKRSGLVCTTNFKRSGLVCCILSSGHLLSGLRKFSEKAQIKIRFALKIEKYVEVHSEVYTVCLPPDYSKKLIINLHN